MKIPRAIKDFTAILSIGAIIGAVIGFGFEDAAQHIEKIGWAETFLGAHLGLLGYDWGSMAQSALVGSAAGSVIAALFAGVSHIKDAARARRQRLRNPVR